MMQAERRMSSPEKLQRLMIAAYLLFYHRLFVLRYVVSAHLAKEVIYSWRKRGFSSLRIVTDVPEAPTATNPSRSYNRMAGFCGSTLKDKAA